jgi:carboxymethylenebutenolidase
MDAGAIITWFEGALEKSCGSYESETYDGAFHGWTVPDNPNFNPEQADHAFRKLTELFAAMLR